MLQTISNTIFFNTIRSFLLTNPIVHDRIRKGDDMKYVYKMQKTVFTAKNIDILQVSRDKNFKFVHRNGRQKHGFMYTVSGTMCYTFLQDDGKSIYVNPGELIFIP